MKSSVSDADLQRLLDNIDPIAFLADIERVECEESLYKFLECGWKYIDPAPFIPGWPIEAVCEHLEAVASGEIRRLIINIPPRCAKSSTVSVAFPAWVWAQSRMGPTSGPGVQIVGASYSKQLSLRDSVKCRRLIESPWYQKHWSDRFQLTSDQNTKGRFDNSCRGERLITSVDAAVTGEGGSIIVVDDPNAANEAFSEATIESTKEWWDGTMSTRLNDPKTGAFIIIQQRLAEDDLTGHILSKDYGDWTHLCLPMRYESDRSFVTTIGWQDPREGEGELLWPERFGEEEVRLLERQLGPFASAGQLQQRPEPKGGGIIKREWWQLWEEDKFPAVSYVVASLDLAYTEKTENDYSACTVWGVFEDKNSNIRVILMAAWQERLELNPLVQKIAESAKKFKVDKLLIESKGPGMSVAQEIQRLYGYEDFGVQLINPGAQDKVARAYSIQHLFADGLIYAPDRQYADMVISQCASFPKGKHDDLTDTVTMSLRHLRDAGVIIRGPERTAELSMAASHRGAPPAPLYPG